MRAEFLRQGIVDAVIVGPPFPLMLSRQGYRILGGPGDAAQGVLSGIGTKDERLREKPEEVKRFLRAVLRGIRFFHEQKEETVSVMMQWLNQDRPLAAQSYDVIKPYFTTNGMTSDANVAFNIETLKTLIKSNKPVPVSQVREFTIIRDLNRELGKPAATR